MSKTIQMTIRVPEELAAKIAKRGSKSNFMLQAAREKLDRDEREAIEASLQCLGSDDKENDISDFSEAQSKVMNRAD